MIKDLDRWHDALAQKFDKNDSSIVTFCYQCLNIKIFFCNSNTVEHTYYKIDSFNTRLLMSTFEVSNFFVKPVYFNKILINFVQF